MTAIQSIKPAPIRKSILVKASQAHCFDVFTAKMARWWNPAHTINPTKSPIAAIVIEPQVGGGWFERGQDGSECRWGTVLQWDPPHSVLLNWQIGTTWQFDAAMKTVLELRFIAEDEHTTRVELEHRDLDHYGDQADQMRGALDNGWGSLLERFVAFAEE
jgi:hypothetical protein